MSQLTTTRQMRKGKESSPVPGCRPTSADFYFQHSTTSVHFRASSARSAVLLPPNENIPLLPRRPMAENRFPARLRWIAGVWLPVPQPGQAGERQCSPRRSSGRRRAGRLPVRATCAGRWREMGESVPGRRCRCTSVARGRQRRSGHVVGRGRRGWWHDDLTEGIPEPRQADANACRGFFGLSG
jgi:hypothetical protein